ncbi:hypothetical protein GCM10023257_45020 [Streptomyces hyderabadensis]|uniref:DUF1048 domain-containing protein n=1 Tax=Streptomyces hyderabadensis TaxID=598549 RepID=A0ABP9IHC3_9ACTN
MSAWTLTVKPQFREPFQYSPEGSGHPERQMSVMDVRQGRRAEMVDADAGWPMSGVRTGRCALLGDAAGNTVPERRHRSRPGQGTPTGLPDRAQGDAEVPVQDRTGQPVRRLAPPGIVDFFEEGVAEGKGVLELIGTDVAAFCDDLIKDSPTYADAYQESISGEPGAARK